MRPDALYLADMVEAANAIASFIAGVDRERFVGDDLLQSAVLLKLQIIGEAAARVSEATRSAIPEVP